MCFINVKIKIRQWIHFSYVIFVLNCQENFPHVFLHVKIRSSRFATARTTAKTQNCTLCATFPKKTSRFGCVVVNSRPRGRFATARTRTCPKRRGSWRFLSESSCRRPNDRFYSCFFVCVSLFGFEIVWFSSKIRLFFPGHDTLALWKNVFDYFIEKIPKTGFDLKTCFCVFTV